MGDAGESPGPSHCLDNMLNKNQKRELEAPGVDKNDKKTKDNAGTPVI